MTVDYESLNKDIFGSLWEKGSATYEAHPTSRHRRRFALNAVAHESFGSDSFVFDYGCGSGVLLESLKIRCGLRDSQLGGCDISESAIELARNRIRDGLFFLGQYPELEKRCSVVLCTEVIEHTPDYALILEWIYKHLAPGGILVLTTPGTPMDPPDIEYGHVQHFELPALVADLERIGFRVEFARRWGFPMFTIQKRITRVFYEHIKRHVIETRMTLFKRVIFDAMYRTYFIHDLINAGPQIFIRARKV